MLVIISFERIFKFFNWSRLVELPNSDEMKMFYTKHDYYVYLENFEFNLKFYVKIIQHKYQCNNSQGCAKYQNVRDR